MIKLRIVNNPIRLRVKDGKFIRGLDGVSPEIIVTEMEGGHCLTISDVTGMKYVDIMDGREGAVGPQGPAGNDGAKGDKGDKGDTGPRGADGIHVVGASLTGPVGVAIGPVNITGAELTEIFN